MVEENMEKYLEKLGNKFVGLWKYQTYNNTAKMPSLNKSYCVTLCINRNHIDTHAHKNPIDALKEAIELLKKIENGKEK